ncbi:4-hydroxybenzoate octaprenyltransferase [Novosphingobium tardum]|uniref:4-hydroxybenzoate octaprenyltransferase n=1 Tax=Novosphingobium tardum TaxID=1538021 RepID=A0ABV8RRV7_9SPHN
MESPSAPAAQAPPDSQHGALLSLLPAAWQPYALLARLDRPIGWWLLFWPCAWAVLLAGGGLRWSLVAWLLIGAVAMRGAGCVYNDIVDRDLDAKVSRTATRPVASGAVSVRAAWIWLGALLAVGLIVWLQLGWPARFVALASLAPVAAYPFMKRITWWPQAWLGIVFSWGALVGWVEVRSDHLGVLALLYAGSIAWVVAYDTIYALQDREDDALIGIRSSALRMGANVRFGVALFYGAAIALWSCAFLLLRRDPLALLALLPIAGHLARQAILLRPDDGAGALTLFRSNRFAGLLMAMACYVVGNTGF